MVHMIKLKAFPLNQYILKELTCIWHFPSQSSSHFRANITESMKNWNFGCYTWTSGW